MGNGSDFCVSMQLHVSSASLHLQMQTWFVFLFFVLFFFEEKKLFILGGTLSKRATKIESRLLVVHSTVIFSKRRKINAF